MYPEECPECHKSFQGKLIPEKDQHLFSRTHFSQVIGVYDQDRDRTVKWMCPFCEHTWKR